MTSEEDPPPDKSEPGAPAARSSGLSASEAVAAVRRRRQAEARGEISARGDGGPDARARDEREPQAAAPAKEPSSIEPPAIEPSDRELSDDTPTDLAAPDNAPPDDPPSDIAPPDDTPPDDQPSDTASTAGGREPKVVRPGAPRRPRKRKASRRKAARRFFKPPALKPRSARLPAVKTSAPGAAVTTPDGGAFRRGAIGAPMRHFSTATRFVLRLIWGATKAVWAFFGDLDAALWAGFKKVLGAVWAVAAASVGFLALCIDDLIRWLPGPAGRAYTAGAVAAAAVASLWIMDELRNAASESGDPQLIVLPPEDAGNPIVARVGGRFIRLSDVRAAYAASEFMDEGDILTARDAFDRGLVRSFVEQRLLARAAREAGITRDPVIATKLSLARDRILASAFMAARIETATSPEELRRLYESQADLVRLGDEVRARHIVVETEMDAIWIVAQLRQGVDFALLARDFSIDPSTKENGGDIGYFTRQMMTPKLANAAFTTGVGDIAPPFFSRHGWHVLEVLDRRPAPSVRFEAVEDTIRSFLADQAVDDALREIVDAADVIYFEPPEGAGVEGDGTAATIGAGVVAPMDAAALGEEGPLPELRGEGDSPADAPEDGQSPDAAGSTDFVEGPAPETGEL